MNETKRKRVCALERVKGKKTRTPCQCTCRDVLARGAKVCGASTKSVCVLERAKEKEGVCVREGEREGGCVR